MPRESSVFLKGEVAFLQGILLPHFGSNYPSKKEEWLEYILEHGFLNIKKEMVHEAHRRAELLSKFAAVTTRRLQEYRRVPGASKDKRKADLSAANVKTMLSLRAHPINAFADEVACLDPTFTGCLKAVRREVEVSGKQVLDNLASRREIAEQVVKLNLYHDIQFKEPEVEQTERPPVQKNEPVKPVKGKTVAIPPPDFGNLINPKNQKQFKDYDRNQPDWWSDTILLANEKGYCKTQTHVDMLFHDLGQLSGTDAWKNSNDTKTRARLCQDVMFKTFRVGPGDRVYLEKY
jgi:hypothetical protein